MPKKKPVPPLSVETQFKPGVSGNPKGRPPGIKNWAVIVQDLLADEVIFKAILKDAPPWVALLPNKNAASAIAVAMQIKAMQGDKKAADWLRKTGFGDKLEITDTRTKKVSVEFVDKKPSKPVKKVSKVDKKPSNDSKNKTS